MIDKILFIASYPNNETIKDGLHQRIKNIDEECKHLERVYLEISWNRHFIKKKECKNNLIIYKLNLFIHFYLIIELIKKFKYIYCHSIYYFEPLLFFSLKNKIVILDVHGAVPEEVEFSGNKWESIWLSFVEKKCFSRASIIICLTNAMRDYYNNKYLNILDKTYKIKSIINNNVFRNIPEDEITHVKNALSIKDNDVIFLYSGNLAKYQNIEMIIEISKKLDAIHENCKFIFLTNDLQTLQSLVNDAHLNNTTVLSVSPEKLSVYYQMSHYGFILRDDHILNRVASPTKMTEYLYYGLIPIVKSENIGDFISLNYDRISIENLLKIKNIKPCKSQINTEIIKNMLLNYDKVKICELED